MKANEASERIYFDLEPNLDNTIWHLPNPNGNSIEYIRTDAFIEKACEFIRKGGNRGDAYIVTEFEEEVFDFIQLAEDFKNYMKGE